jgi:hypothetical protein
MIHAYVVSWIGEEEAYEDEHDEEEEAETWTWT